MISKMTIEELLWKSFTSRSDTNHLTHLLQVSCLLLIAVLLMLLSNLLVLFMIRYQVLFSYMWQTELRYGLRDIWVPVC